LAHGGRQQRQDHLLHLEAYNAGGVAAICTTGALSTAAATCRRGSLSRYAPCRDMQPLDEAKAVDDVAGRRSEKLAFLC